MFTWEDGTLVTKPYVEVNGTKYEVNMPEYSGSTPITAENLNKMQNEIEDELKENTLMFKEKYDDASSLDLDDFLTTGIYYFNNTTPLNAPQSSYTYSTLFVIYISSYMCWQIMSKNENTIYIRKKAGSPSSWGDWIAH